MKKILMILAIMFSLASNASSRIQAPINFEVFNKSKYDIQIEIMQKQSSIQKEGIFGKVEKFFSNPDELVIIKGTNRSVPPQGFFEAGLSIGNDLYFISIMANGNKFNYQ